MTSCIVFCIFMAAEPARPVPCSPPLRFVSFCKISDFFRISDFPLPSSTSSPPRLEFQGMATGPADILLIRLKSIGDILFTLPAVNLVRDCFPNAGLTFLTSSENAPLLRGFVALNNVLTLDRALYRRKNPLAIFAHTLELLRRLRRSRFSLVIDFQGYGETALLTSLTGAPQRWGTIYRRGRRWAYTSAQPRD